MIDILVYLFENYATLGARPKARTLRRKLSAVGFEDEAIAVALQWLDGLHAAPALDLPDECRALRIYHPDEQDKLGPEGLAFIAFLETSKVLSPALRELVVERAMILADEPVPLAKFKIIVLMVLWSREQPLDPLIVAELLDDGDARRLH